MWYDKYVYSFNPINYSQHWWKWRYQYPFTLHSYSLTFPRKMLAEIIIHMIRPKNPFIEKRKSNKITFHLHYSPFSLFSFPRKNNTNKRLKTPKQDFYLIAIFHHHHIVIVVVTKHYYIFCVQNNWKKRNSTVTTHSYSTLKSNQLK